MKNFFTNLFGKRSIQSEYYSRIKKLSKAAEYQKNTNPICGILNDKARYQKIMIKNKEWILQNREEIKKFLDNQELKKLVRSYGFVDSVIWYHDEKTDELAAEQIRIREKGREILESFKKKGYATDRIGQVFIRPSNKA